MVTMRWIYREKVAKVEKAHEFALLYTEGRERSERLGEKL